jgi:hypothetical protein
LFGLIAVTSIRLFEATAIERDDIDLDTAGNPSSRIRGFSGSAPVADQ